MLLSYNLLILRLILYLGLLNLKLRLRLLLNNLNLVLNLLLLYYGLLILYVCLLDRLTILSIDNHALNIRLVHILLFLHVKQLLHSNPVLSLVEVRLQKLNQNFYDGWGIYLSGLLDVLLNLIVS